MIGIEDLEFSGVGYITTDVMGTWVWSIKPILENEQWVLPKEYRGKPNMTLLLNQVNGSVLTTLLNMAGHEFNDTFKVLKKPRIFKVILEEVPKFDDYDVEQLKPFCKVVSPARCEMFEAHNKICDDFMMGRHNTQQIQPEQPIPEGKRNED